MRELMVIDYKNYIEDGTVCKRTSVRGIIIQNKKLGMIHSLKWGYYIFPGGGQDKGETNLQTLIREVEEETGLIVKTNSVKEYGSSLTKEQGRYEDLFVQECFYYLCDVEAEMTEQHLEDYEAEDEFVLEWAEPKTIIDGNNQVISLGQMDDVLLHGIHRETEIIKMLVEENYI